MKDPKIQIACAGSIYLHAMSFEKAGDMNEGHSHTYDHLTLVASGSVAVESNGRRSEYKADPFHIIYIPKSVQHRIIALEAGTVVCCIHALHDKDNPGEILDPSMIPAGTPDWSLVVPLLEGDAKKLGIK